MRLGLGRLSLLLGLLGHRDPQGNLLPAGALHKGSLLLGRSQAGEDMSKGHRVGAHAKGRPPFFRHRLGQAGDARLGQRVVGLSRVAVHARRRGDVDDAAGLAVLDAEVRSGGADEVEGRGAVQTDNGVPLLVRRLVNDAVPRVAGIVDNDVDLAVAKLGGATDQRGNVVAVQHITSDGDGLATRRGDSVGDGLALAGVNVGDNHLGAFFGEETGGLGADALTAASDDGDLAGEHALRVVEVGGELGYSVRHGGRLGELS